MFIAKTEGQITITDFDRSDVLVNLASGSAVETHKYFHEFARQVGRDVVYEYDGVRLLLKNTDINLIGARHFSDAKIVKDAGLLF